MLALDDFISQGYLEEQSFKINICYKGALSDWLTQQGLGTDNGHLHTGVSQNSPTAPCTTLSSSTSPLRCWRVVCFLESPWYWSHIKRPKKLESTVSRDKVSMFAGTDTFAQKDEQMAVTTAFSWSFSGLPFSRQETSRTDFSWVYLGASS